MMKNFILLVTIALSAIASGKNADNDNQGLQVKLPSGQSALMHIAINAIDVDSTLAFYKNAFGFAKHYDWTQATSPQNGQVLFKGRGIYLDVGGNTYLELFPTGKQGQSMKTGTISHFSLSVNNLDETYKKALQFGAKKNATTQPSYWDGSPTSIELNGNPTLKEKVAYIEGPNGEAIELYELLTAIPTK